MPDEIVHGLTAVPAVGFRYGCYFPPSTFLLDTAKYTNIFHDNSLFFQETNIIQHTTEKWHVYNIFAGFQKQKFTSPRTIPMIPWLIIFIRRWNPWVWSLPGCLRPHPQCTRPHWMFWWGCKSYAFAFTLILYSEFSPNLIFCKDDTWNIFANFSERVKF